MDRCDQYSHQALNYSVKGPVIICIVERENIETAGTLHFLPIALSILRFTISDYHFGFFKLYVAIHRS